MKEATTWRRSSFCSDNQCAEIKMVGDAVLLRNSNRPDSTIELTMAEWESFKKAVLNGEF
ncbi:MAG TPA: DUF397 domain-containing protein [Actinoplanes sp.]|jgi:hypothetical protein|nr:DUF397 domain-containing protein [Actinoplanes sp.]